MLRTKFQGPRPFGSTPYIRLVKFQLVPQIPDVYVSACVLADKLFCRIFHRIPKLFMVQSY